MRYLKSTASVFALLATTANVANAAQAQPAPNTTPANVNVLNLLSPYLNLNATSIGQSTLQLNLQNAIATNNNANLTLEELAISDANLFGSRSNTSTTAFTGNYGPGANLAGPLITNIPVTGTQGTITGIEPVGGLGAVLGPIYVTGIAPTGTGNTATNPTLPNTASLLVNAYNFTSTDLGVAKNYFADGAASNASGSAATSTAAVAPPGYTLPTANGLPNTTNSVYDLAYGVTNTGPGQDVYGSSRPVQVTPTGINQFDSVALSGLSTNPSFPSGHTNYAYTDSVLLAMLVPQDYQSMLARASAYGNSRIVLGVHYPLDIIASRAFSAYDLSQAFTNPLYMNNASTTGTAINLPTLFNAANTELQPYLATQCGNTVAACSTSAANTANDPYVPSAALAASVAANLTYGLPTLTFAQAPQEAAPAGGPDASILLATLYGGSTPAAMAIATPAAPLKPVTPTMPGLPAAPIIGSPNATGLDGSLTTNTINQIIQNTEGNALAAFYGTSLSYWTRINLYAAGGYFGNLTGTLALDPTDVVTTDVSIASGGVLYANGMVTGSTIVNSGGTLSGTGTVATTMIATGGTLAPGGQTAIGATTVNGNLTFAPGSNYNIRVTPAGNDSTTVTGTAALNGVVNLSLATGVVYNPSTQYTILTTTGGPSTITGAFTAVNTNRAFIAGSAALVGDPTVVLTVQALPFNVVAQTNNQNNVGVGLTTGAAQPLSANGAAIVANLQAIPSVAQAQATLDSLSGEGITAAQNAAHRSVSEFTSSIMDQTTFYGSGQGATNSIVLTDGLPSGALGYAAPVHELADLPSVIRNPGGPVDRPRTWRAWATGFGGVEDIHGNNGLGSAEQNDNIFGGTLGVDYQLTSQYLAGIAVGGSDGEFSVAGRATSGSTTGGHIAFYDLATFGDFYGASTDSISFFGNKTSRFVSGFGGLPGENDRGNFDSREFRTRLEVGRHFGAYGGILTPFVALEIAELRSNGFSETNVAGPTLLGLNVQGQSSASVPSFVGARYQGSATLGKGMTISPNIQVAYVHEFAPQRSQLGALISLPGSTFLVDGARPSSNAAQVKTGAELSIGPRSTLFATFDGEFSGQSQFYGGKGGFKYVW